MNKLNQEGKRQQSLTPMQEIINPLVRFNPIMDINVSNMKIYLVKTVFNPRLNFYQLSIYLVFIII